MASKIETTAAKLDEIAETYGLTREGGFRPETVAKWWTVDDRRGVVLAWISDDGIGDGREHLELSVVDRDGAPTGDGIYEYDGFSEEEMEQAEAVFAEAAEWARVHEDE